MIFPVGAKIIRLPEHRRGWKQDCEALGFPENYAFTVARCDADSVTLKETNEEWDTCRFALAPVRPFNAEDWL